MNNSAPPAEAAQLNSQGMLALRAGSYAEAERLFRALLNVDCEPGRTWDLAGCRRIAPLTLEINRLKKEKDAVILTHSYVEPEIIYGVGDFKGDSYFLSLKAKEAKAKVILFAGVVFMAETAKILSPDATVIVPDRGSGCSLADSLTGDQLRKLKAAYPDAAVVCYILAHFSVAGPALTYAQIWERCQFMENMRKAQWTESDSTYVRRWGGRFLTDGDVHNKEREYEMDVDSITDEEAKRAAMMGPGAVANPDRAGL